MTVRALPRTSQAKCLLLSSILPSKAAETLVSAHIGLRFGLAYLFQASSDLVQEAFAAILVVSTRYLLGNLTPVLDLAVMGFRNGHGSQ